jgi:adenosine deaminase/adenosine deaminase CECR1
MNKPISKLVLLLSFALTVMPANGDDFETTSKYYDSLFEGSKANEAGLAMFINLMPKGGDLHHHYSGTIYAETYLDWVKEKKWLIDSCTLTIVKEAKPEKKDDCKLLTVDGCNSKQG